MTPRGKSKMQGLRAWLDSFLLISILALVASAARPSAARAVLASSSGDWQAVPPPSGRAGQSAVLDAARGRVLVFGGFDGTYCGDLWLLSPAGVWTALVLPGGPPARSDHSAIYDPVGDRMIVFGGTDAAGYRDDVWALMLAGNPVWVQLAPTGPSPAARAGHSAIYDPVRQRMLVFAGEDGGLVVPNDCWQLSLAGAPAWSEVTTAGTQPAGRREHTAVYDPVHDAMLVFGGDDGEFCFNDCHALALASGTWSAVSVSGPLPPARSGHTALYDAAAARMLIHGGANGGFRYGDTQALALAGPPAWAALPTTGSAPSARAQHAAVLDAASSRLLVIGGSDGVRRSDVHALDVGASLVWSVVVPATAVPSPRYRQSAIVDPVRRRMILFGGYEGLTPYPATTWEFTLADSAQWRPLAVGGNLPPGRYGHTAIYDPVRQRMLVFGGHDGVARVNEVWALVLAGTPVWTQLTPSGTPPSPRQNHTAIYDPVRQRMLVFGGFDGVRRNDVWSLSLSGTPTWALVAPAGAAPTARTNAACAYDAVGDRMLVVGGSDGVLRDDVWALALAGTPAWSQLLPSGSAPTPRAGHTLVYDAARHRMVLYGGDDGTYRNDVWGLNLVPALSWAALTPSGWVPPGRRYHTAVYDPWRDAMVACGGWNNDYRGDTWRLVWGEPVSDAPGTGPRARMELGIAPHPVRGAMQVWFYAPASGDAVLELFDAAGRRALPRQEIAVRPGVQHLTVGAVQHLAPGVYFLRLTAAGRSITRSAVVLR